MLDSLVDACVRRRLFVFALTAVLIVFGVDSYNNTPIEAFPDVTNLQVNVVAEMPGMAPPEIERQVTIPIERAVNGIPGLVGLRSESLFGLSLTYLTFDEGVDSFHARVLVEQRLGIAEVPASVSPRLGPDATPLGEIYHLRVVSERHSARELRAEIEWRIAPRLRRVAGVADVVGRGGFLDELHVEIDPVRLDAYGLHLADVRQALEASSRNAGGGFLVSGEQQLVVRGVGQLVQPSELAQVAIRTDDGVPITVGDVARVVSSFVPRQGTAAYGVQHPSVEAAVLMRRGENPSRVLDGIHAAVAELNHDELPQGMRIVPFYDRSNLVERTLATVHHNLFVGAFLCISVVWLFVRTLRGSLVVAAVIPLALLCAFIGLRAIGLPANLISMGAIDFGILVDGGVILVESVLHQLATHPGATESERLDQISRAARDVARPTFFAMSIVIAALVPVYALQSVEGRIFRPLALTYTFALVGALVFSLTLVPALCATAFRKGVNVVHAEGRFAKRAAELHQRGIRFLGAHRIGLALGLVAFLAITAAVGSRLGSEFLPELDEGDFTVFAELPTSTSLDTAELVLAHVRQRLLRYPEVREVATKIGRPEDGTDNESVNMAESYVHLAPIETWRPGMTTEILQDRMRRDLLQIPGIQLNFSQPIRDNVEEAISGVRGKVVLKIYGTDLEEMRNTLLAALQVVRRVPGVVEASLYRDRSVPQLEVTPDRAAIARAGVSMVDVQETLEMAVAGTVVTNWWHGERVVPVRLRYALPERESPTRIGEILLPNSNGTRVPLRDVATVELRPGRASINRETGSRALALKFNIEGRDAGSVVADAIRAVHDHVHVPADCTIRWGGEFENQQRAMKRLAVVVPIALALVVGFLAWALQSSRSAASVISVVPWCLSGGVFALAVTHINLSVSAAIGFIALLGQVSLAALLVVGAIDDAKARGENGIEAAIAGAALRLRPVAMTSMLAMFGLLPMAVSTAPGSETQRPFALVMVGGMVTTCLVTLLVLPILHAAWPNRPKQEVADA